jgi:hypothetical protein
VKLLLASLLLQGEATGEVALEAADLFAQAARMGDVDGEYNLGVCFQRGVGVVADQDMALQLYRSAAEKGHPSAQLTLGDLSFEIGGAKGLRAAAGWYERAAAQGVPGAAFALARLYETGAGVEADREKAIVLNAQAAQAGHAEAKLALARLDGSQAQAI